MQKLNIDKKVAYTVAIAIMVASLLTLLIPSKYVLWGAAPVLAIAAAVTCMVIKKRRIHSYNKGQVLLIVSVTAALYLMLYYLSGIRFGFVISPKGVISFGSIFKSIIPIAAVIASSEIIRSVLLAQNEKPIMVMSYVIGVVSEIICAGGVPSFTSSLELADFLGISLFPALTANILFTYLSRRYGVLPNAVYRAILTLYVYLIPVTSDAPRILEGFVLLVLPIAAQLFIGILYEKKNEQARRRESKLRFVFPTLACVLALSVVMLISCQFRYGILVIATESMTGEINKGDAVVYENYEIGEAEIGDVIVFTKNGNGRRVVHRIVDIIPIDQKNTYVTKGDANDGVDAGYITDSDIIGTVRFKVAYIGYPSIWLRDIFSK